jgi:hypothetical protein
MAKYLPLPDGSSLEVPDSMSLNEAMSRAKEAFPELYAAPKAKQKEGVFADLAASTKNLLNIGKTGIGALTGDTTEAAQAGVQRQQKLGEEYKSGLDIDKITGKFGQGEYLGAAKEAFSQVPSAIASIAPSVGQEMGAAAIGRLGGSALGALVGRSQSAADTGARIGQYAVPLAVNFVQALGSQAQEKVKAQVEAGEKPDVDALELAPYAAGNAALNLVGTKIAMPGVFKKVINEKVAAEAGDATRQALIAEASKIAGRGTLNTIGRGIGGFAIGELPTEILQDVVDRAAIGKPLADDEAIKQYRDTAFTMLLSSPLGGGFGLQQRSQSRGVVARDEAQQQAIADTQNRQLAEKEAAAKAAAEAQAEADRKADPAYASQFLTDYETRFAEFKAIPTKKPGKDATFEEREIFAENKAKKAELGKQLAADTGEYRRLKALKAGEDAQLAEKTAAEEQAKANEALMQQPGAQLDMFGNPVMTDMTTRPMSAAQLPTPVQFTQQRSQLLRDRDTVQTKLAEAKTTAQYESALAGLDTIDNELKKLDELRSQIEEVHGPIPKFGSAIELDAALATAKKKLADMTAKGASTDEDKAAIRKQLEKVKELEKNQSLFGPGNARPADEAKLAAEMAAGREQSGQAQRTVNTEAARLSKLGENYLPTGEEEARQAREQRQTQLEVEKMEGQAAMDRGRTAQYTLFGGEELSSDQRSGTGALSTNSRARLQATLQIARATGNRQGVADAVAALQDLKAQEDAQTGAGQQTYSFEELQKTTGQKVPTNVAAQQEAADARDTAYANVVDIVSKFNQGKAKKEALDRARDFLVESLAKDIETSRGKPLTTAEKLQVQDQANKLLDELVARFGDTRNVSSVGTKLDQAFQPAQNEDGTFNTEAVPGMGFFTAESKGPGYRTFASPYAAAMSIQEGLDSIRNKGVQGELGATTTDTTLTPKEITPEMVSNQLSRLLAQDPDKTDPEVRKTAIQIADNLKALGGNLDVVSEYLSNPTPERTREVKAVLADVEAGKRSETETPKRETAFGTAYGAPKTAIQEELPGIETTGTKFATAKEFDEYLASDALAQIRKDHGLVTQTVSRLKAIAAPFAKKAEGLRAQLAALQAKYAASQKVSADEVDLAKSMSAEAKANLKAVIDRLDAELNGLQISYLQARSAFDFAVTNSEQIAANIAANVEGYTKPEADALAAYEAAKQNLAKIVETGMVASKPHPKENLDFSALLKRTKDQTAQQLAAAQAEVVRTTQLYRMAIARNQTQQRVVKFLDVDLSLQMQLQAELIEMNRAGEELLNAGVALELAKQKQDRSRKNKAAIKLATSDVDAALQIETEAIAAAEAKKAADIAEMNATAKELADAEKEASKADTIAERQRKQRERDNEALYTETIYDREERDRELRRLENEARERMANIPGERMDFSKRREMLNVVDSSRETEDEINQNIADAQQALDQIAKNIELQTEAIANAKVTIDVLKPKKRLGSRQQAELDRAEQNLEDATKALEKSKEHKSLFEGVIDRSNRAIVRLSERVAEINEAFSNDPEVAAKIKKSVNGRIATRRSKILEQSQKLNSLRDNEKNKEARTKIRHELAKLKREVRGLERLVETERGLVRTTVGVTPDAVSRLYDIAANTALPDNVREAAQAKITEYEDKVEAESLTAQPKPTKEDDTEEAEAARKQMRSPKRGPLVKDVRTGKVTQAGQSRPVTSLQAQRGATKAVGFEQALLKMDKISDLREKLEAARDRAIAANNTERVEQLNAYEKTLDKELKQAEKDIGKYRAVLRTAVSSSGPTLQSAQVTRIANDIVKPWAKVPNIEVVDSVDDLLPRIQAQLREENEVANEVPGLYDPQTDTVFLISSALRSGKDVELTIMHEVAGHYGLRNMLGATYTKTMNDLYDGNTSVRQKADAKMEANPKLTREIAVEEVLADAAENTPYANQQMRNALRRFASAIKQWLFQKLGIKNISDFEVLQLVADSRRYVRQGIGGRGGEVTTSRAVLRTTQPKYESENDLTALANDIVAQPKSFTERFGKNIALEAEQEAVDMRAGLRETLKAGAAAMGNDKQFTQAMASVLKSDQYMPMVSASLQNGTLEVYTDAKGLRQVQSTGKNPAVDVFKAVERIPGGNSEAKFALASAYMIAQRALNKGLTALDLGALKVTQQKLDAAMAAANANPKLKAALENVREKYNAYNAGQIKFLADTGYISKATAAEWLKDGDYVPYYRVRDDGTAELVLGGEKTITVGDVRHQPYLAELKGGQTKILPLNESIMRNTMLITKAGMGNLASKEIAYALQMIGKGTGSISEKTGEATDKMSIKKGKNPGGPNIVVFKQEPDPKDPKDDGQRYVRVETEGTVAEGVPTALLVRSLEGAHLTLPGFLKLGGIAGDFLRKGITRMPPYILRQLYRDPMAAAFTAGLNYSPFTAVVKAGAEFIKANMGTSSTSPELIKKGLIQSGVFAGDPSDLSAFALQLAGGKDQGAIDKLLAGIDRVSIRADAATRALVYENALANGLSEVEADMMVMESMNFYKRGLSPSIQYANRLYPFMNAQIQGLNVLIKAARGRMPFNEQQKIQQKFFNNAMMLFGTAVIYAMAMEDDETFKNAKPRDKYSNFFIHLPGVDEALKIAIPYEAGWFFSAGVAAVDSIKGTVDSKQQFNAIREMFIGSIPGASSDFLPQIVKPIYEVMFNKNTFTGGPLESSSVSGRLPEDRYIATTTELSKQVAKVLPGLSPIQIDHLVKAYFGAAPIVAMAGVGSLFTKDSAVEKPETRLSQTPIFGSLFQRKMGGADNEAVFDIAEKALQTNQSFSALKRSGTPEDARAFREAHKAELQVAPMAGTYKQNMARLKLQEEIITNRLNLSPAEKRARIDQIDKARQETAERFMQRIREIESRS